MVGRHVVKLKLSQAESWPLHAARLGLQWSLVGHGAGTMLLTPHHHSVLLLPYRWGRELDCELKQFRLMGDLLMQGGASLELATALAPQFFLPMACTANLAKNLAAVAASSTRAPIYK
jgi:hypothetical protein